MYGSTELMAGFEDVWQHQKNLWQEKKMHGSHKKK
jgi:hypothetical protein